jgi:signal transduction histidine kinase/CheY-like chemotaxis protein
MLVASLAYSLAIFQFWFFIKKRRPAWMGWGSLVCLAAALYNTIIFFNFQTNNISSLMVLHRCMHTSLLLLIYAMTNFIYSYLSRGSRLGHNLFLLSLLVWVALIWFSPWIIVDHLASRASLWLGGYYPRPTMRPLGLVMQTFLGLIICHFFFIWPWKRRRRLPEFPYLAAGMIFWAVLALYDILVSMGMPARLFLAEYGVIGFCFSLAGFSITNYLSLEQSLLQAQKTEALARLAAGIAHDFNNLLTVISLNTELMLGRQDPEAQNRCGLERIMAATKRGGDLVRGLLSLGRQGRSPGQPLDLNQEIGRVAELLAPILPSSVALELCLRPGLPPAIGDPAQVEQVILNLGINARDAMPQGGKLVLATSHCRLDRKAARLVPQLKPGDYILLTVADSGLGMDEGTLRRAFDPFFTTKPASKGSGLGLATAQTIMEAQGGAITCASVPGQGTVFSLYWPSGAPPLPAGQQGAPEAHAAVDASRTILLVDDEATFLDALEEVLDLDGHRVLKARDGQEAVRQFQSQPARLVILDLRMPGMSAQACLKRLRKINPRVKVIVVSGDLSQAQKSLPLDANVLAHLAKPVRVNQLRRLIAEVLAKEP